LEHSLQEKLGGNFDLLPFYFVRKISKYHDLLAIQI
jgi:hypothetical protein